MLLLFIAVTAAQSCKKKVNDNPFSTVQIKTLDKVHGGSIFHYRFVYDASNNIDSIKMVGGGLDTGHYSYSVFSYFGSSYSVTNESGFNFKVQAATNGLMLKVLLYDTVSFIYDNNVLGAVEVKTPTTVTPFYTKTTYNYYWNNGDIARETYSGNTDSFFYNQSRTGQAGDPWRIEEFLSYGRSYTKTSHLLNQKNHNGTWAEKYLYQFDANGRISQLQKIVNNNGAVPNDTVYYNYGY
jgi:hypothetical protein